MTNPDTKRSDMLTDPFFYAVALPAVVILGLAKGGFAGLGLVAVPLMTLAVPPVQAASIILPILLVQDVVGVWAFRHSWDGASLAVLLPGAAAGIGIGYALAAYVEPAAVELAVGATSIVFAGQRLWTARTGVSAVAAPPWLGGLCGVAAGFTSQIAHAGVPPFQMYVLPKQLPRDTFIGTSALFFATVNWMKVPAYLALDQLTAQNMATAGALLPVAITSTWAGVWLIRRISGERFYVLVYALLIFVGLKLSWDGMASLLT